MLVGDSQVQCDVCLMVLRIYYGKGHQSETDNLGRLSQRAERRKFQLCGSL